VVPIFEYDVAFISVVSFQSLYNARLLSCVFQGLESTVEQVRLKYASRIVNPNETPQARPLLSFASITCDRNLRPSEDYWSWGR
jgi:hypothetical protein